MHTEEIKERIILAAMKLIRASGGDIAAVTTRAVAEKAQVGVGLINYHFQTKDHLIQVCVRRMIHTVVTTFTPPLQTHGSDAQRLVAWAEQVFAFLFDNPSVSRISILQDFTAYDTACNSAGTQKGFANALRGVSDPRQKQLLCFCLTSIMQAAFLAQETGDVLLGFDLRSPDQRGPFIEAVVSLLFYGVGGETG